MTAATRRLWLYGLLLLLPALAVGGLALGLLAREQSRLAERELAARESQRAAVETRARLIAENIELLLGDVQSALMQTLREAPASEPRAFLTEWQATNPLVRDVFRATSEGLPVWGASSPPLRAWLAQSAPWLPAPAASSTADSPPPQEQPNSTPLADNAPARRDISSNVIQYQRARQEIQEVAKVKSFADARARNVSDAKDQVLTASAPAAATPASAPAASGAFGSTRSAASDDLFKLSEKKVAAEPPAPGDPITRAGWSPWRDREGLHLFGWLELPDRTVIGIELRLDAIKARLGEVFPATPEPGEAYALRDTAGRSWHAVGPAELPLAVEVPLADTALPGWTVIGQTLAAGYGSSDPGGVFKLGTALVALLILAILAAGALLLRQARLSEAEAALKTSFVANVSHELKTPLTTIRLYAELLAQGRVREPARQAEYLATISNETQRLARLVGNVLDFSRLEQGKKKYEPTALDLAAELERLAATHGPRLAEAGLALRSELPAELMLQTDRDAVGQIVLNLLDNACKYAAEGGEVTLSLSRSTAGGAELHFADRGPGVPPDQRERIFSKFHRVDDRLTAEKSGAGLGLSIARQLARGLGGDLRCEARPGGGAVFILSLPSAPPS